MATDDLLVDVVGHVVDRELAGIGGNLRLQNHFEQDVAELLAHVVDVAFLDGGDGPQGQPSGARKQAIVSTKALNSGWSTAVAGRGTGK